MHINGHLAMKGGVEAYLFSLLPLLSERGITSTWVYGAGDPGLFQPALHLPEISATGWQAQRTVRRAILALLAREEPNVVHVHNVQNVGVLQACLAYGPTVVTNHDYRWVCPANTFFYRRTQGICTRTCGPGCFTTTLTRHCLTPRPQFALYYYYRARWLVQNTSPALHLIAPSSGARDRLLEAGYRDEAITVLPYFCPLEPSQTPREIPAEPTITYIGRIAPNKGHEFFVEALGLLPDQIRGVLVGNLNDAGEQHLHALARVHGCEGRLTVHRWASREEVLRILDNTTIFIFPSLWPETLGIVGLEALSRGVPVVASKVGGVGEWLLDGENGYMVPPKDAGAIREAVLSLMASDASLRTFGERGIQTIRDRFLPAQHVGALVALYKKAAAGMHRDA